MLRGKTYLIWLLVLALACSFAAPLALAEKETLSFSVYQRHYGYTMVGTPVFDEWTRRMEDYLGVTLDMDITELDGNDYTEKMQIYLASGDLADVFFCRDMVALNNLGDVGLLVDLAEYEDLFTYYSVYLNANDGFERAKVTTPEGKMFFFGQGVYDTNTGTQCGFGMRGDIMREHGLTPPSTFEDLYTVCKQLKELYPDSYPLGQYAGSLVNILTLMNRVNFGTYFDGEEYVYGPLSESERMRQLIDWYSRMYADKLVDPEFLTKSKDQRTERILNGTYMFLDLAYAGSIGMWNSNEVYDVEWTLIPRLKTFDGEPGWKYAAGREGVYFREWEAVAVSANTSGAQRENILKLIDYEYSDEMRMLENWGIEGESYVMTEDGPVWSEEVLQSESAIKALEKWGCYGSKTIRPGFGGSRICDLVAEETLIADVPCWNDGEYFYENPWMFSHLYEGGESTVWPAERMKAVTLSEDERDEMTNVMTPLDTYVSEQIVKFMTCERSMDEWDAFIAECDAIGDWRNILSLYNAYI